MIKGTGIDIVEIRRIESMIRKYGRHFLDKVFSQTEIAYCGGTADTAVHYAGRWAVKEAFYKALPGPCQRRSGWKAIEILPASGADSAPMIAVVDRELDAEMKKAGITRIHHSISHEKQFCVAMVVLEGG
jgi:holo-[acyl-carrier-protein] synthase